MAESYGQKLHRFMSGDRKGLHPSEDPEFRDQLVADARRAIDDYIKIAPPAPGRGKTSRERRLPRLKDARRRHKRAKLPPRRPGVIEGDNNE